MTSESWHRTVTFPLALFIFRSSTSVVTCGCVRGPEHAVFSAALIAECRLHEPYWFKVWLRWKSLSTYDVQAPLEFHRSGGVGVEVRESRCYKLSSVRDLYHIRSYFYIQNNNRSSAVELLS